MVRVLARSLGHVRSSVSPRNDILMFCFFSFLARRIGRSLAPTSFFFLSFLRVGLAWPMSKLYTWGSREKSLESRTRKETQVREVGTSVTRVVICVSQAFCSTDQEKIETARSLGKERRALLFLRPSRLRDSLVRSLATCGGEPAGTLPESIQFSRSH